MFSGRKTGKKLKPGSRTGKLAKNRISSKEDSGVHERFLRLLIAFVAIGTHLRLVGTPLCYICALLRMIKIINFTEEKKKQLLLLNTFALFSFAILSKSFRILSCSTSTLIHQNFNQNHDLNKI